VAAAAFGVGAAAGRSARKHHQARQAKRKTAQGAGGKRQRRDKYGRFA
jgi:hypothetical protein